MKEVAAKLKLFFSGFELPAYTRQNVPDEVEIPYIAYDLVEPRWDRQANMNCQVYYPKKHVEELLTKADEIKAAIGHGIRITMSEGCIVLYLGNQQGQQVTDEMTDSVIISILINSYHMPGV